MVVVGGSLLFFFTTGQLTTQSAADSLTHTTAALKDQQLPAHTLPFFPTAPPPPHFLSTGYFLQDISQPLGVLFTFLFVNSASL